MRVVIDTNVFVSSFLSATGKPRKVINAWRDGRLTLCLSQEIVDEYVIVFNRLGVDENLINELMHLFARGHHTLFTAKTSTLQIVENDPDDNKFFECALALKAKFIISGDNHLLSVKKYMNIIVYNPSQFLDQL